MTAAAAPSAGGRRRRIVLPVLALLALLVGTLVAHAVEQSDRSDPAYLSPVSDAGVGAKRLAERLAGRGVTVDRRTSTGDALDALGGGPATLFVTTPNFADLDLVSSARVPSGSHIVMVAPQSRELSRTGWPATVDGNRWAASAPAPDCADPVAGTAGPAAARRLRYRTGQGVRCYDGGLVVFAAGGVTVTLIGAADPFRNDRLDEHRNAALAVGLLARRSRVIWLDRHRPEEPPPQPTATSTPTPTPTTYPGAAGDRDDPYGPGGEDQEPTGDARPQDESEDGGGLRSAVSPLAQAFPPAMWATAALLLLAAIALAAAAARRLGTPVAEPLPSRVPADETMLGHAALYQRARARGPSLDILRAAARRRLAAHLGLPPDVGTDRLAAATGRPPDDLRRLLDGDPPQNDDDLVAEARQVQALVRDVTATRIEQGDPT